MVVKERFLVGAFFLKEKSPTITVGSFLVGAFLVKSARLLQWIVFSRRLFP